MKMVLLFSLILMMSAFSLIASHAAQAPTTDEEIDYSSKRSNEIVEAELARYFPPFVPHQKTLLRTFVEVNKGFEGSNSPLLVYPSYFLESENIEASYDALKDLKEHSEAVLNADAEYVREVYNNREALADAYVGCYAASHHVESGNSRARDSKFLISSPLAIILAYISGSLEIPSLLNQALMYATTKRSGPLCRTLLLSGANPNFHDAQGWTPLIRVAARRHCLRRDVGAFDRWKEQENRMIARLAGGDIELPLFQFVPLLVDFGADVNRADSNGIAPLHAACLHANVPVVRQLLNCQTPAALSPLTNDGYTPMMFAGRNSHRTRNRQLILIQARDHAQLNMCVLTEEDDFALNMPYATVQTAKENEKELDELARRKILRVCAQKRGRRNIFPALQMREVGAVRPLKRIVKRQASSIKTLPAWPCSGKPAQE